MRKLLHLVALLSLCAGTALAQQSLQQSFTELVVAAPPLTVSGQSVSSSTGTALNTNATGGTVASGVYRVCVTYFSAANTETPCSSDTTASSTITTTGSTSTVVVSSPVAAAAPATAIGYRIYIGANAGGTGAETLQTINASVCTLSASSTPSCAIGQPATFTSSAGFTSGSGGPASPGTFLTTPTGNAANQAMFQNSLYETTIINWVVSGTAPSACTFNLQAGASTAALSNVGQTITCTASGSYALPSTAVQAYMSVNLATFTAGGTNTSVVFTVTSLPYPVAYYWGPAAPTSSCVAFTGLFVNTGTTTSSLYYCSAGTWTSVTLP